jgi:hypothetical protein
MLPTTIQEDTHRNCLTTFYKGQEYEIPQVHKLKDEAKAYLVDALLKQCKKLVLHQVTVNQKILQPKIASEGSFTKKEIQKKNCLTLIVKNYNVTYLASAITENLKQILGAKNIMEMNFPREDPAQDLHVRICNLKVLNPAVYKQYVRKKLKLLHMYTRCMPHPCSLDGTSCPT